MRIAIGSGLAALCILLAAGTVPASAEFFGCNDKTSVRTTVSHRVSAPAATHRAVSRRTASRFTHEFAAQSRPRITIYPRKTRPGPNAKRYCRSWLVKESRVSGTVIVPRMYCWWQ